MDPSNHETLEDQQLRRALLDQLVQTAPTDLLSRMPACSSDAPRQPSTATSQSLYNVFPPSSSSNHHPYTTYASRSVTAPTAASPAHQSPYASSQTTQGFQSQPQLCPHPVSQHNAAKPTIYPPGARPIARPTTTSHIAVVLSALRPTSSYANLLHALAPTTTQRPTFAPPGPASRPGDSTLELIKHTTDTFNAAATNDPVYYLLYRRVLDAQPNVFCPELVYFIRLELQVGWIEYLERQCRQDEIGNITALVHERKNYIKWLVQQDKSVKPRAGQYISPYLAKFAPLDFEPSEVPSVACLLDRLYVLETDAFYKTAEVLGPSRSEYRIRVATYIDYDGGRPKVYQDLDIWKKLGFAGLSRMLSNATSNIQTAQFHYNNGWECGGTHGHWLYQIVAEGPYQTLASDTDLEEMKGILAQGQGVLIIHTQQYEIRENLELADALGLTLDHPGQACKPLPPGYLSTIMREYPNHIASSYLSHRVVTTGSPGLAIQVRRGRRSEVVRLAKRRHDKERKVLGALATRPKSL
ncbi:hypothetical protein E4T39_05841 [Aureobasidium subglaciale]|nr:hypothetical protein E4T39_05841 [Aureobasidium subglaciale]